MKAVKQLELSGSDVAKVHGLEEELKRVTAHSKVILPSPQSFSTVSAASLVKDTWNKRRTNFPRKFAKSKVEAVPALKQGTLVMKRIPKEMTKNYKRN